ncbi:ammonium transporter [Nitrospirillum amazonense]|uniref:Ammonium transporter n=2 Tax=Nitrospirillum amazonense TaxID=28077 RepID=A0A560FAZ1_9PROT|nr:ammonium transporter [Nitrospirillum amazonense]
MGCGMSGLGRRFLGLGACALAAGLPALAMAQDAAAPAAAATAPTISGGDTAWMLMSTALVLMMTIPGLALFYGGMVRKFNVLAMVMQSFTITCLVTVIWALVGYSLSFTAASDAADAKEFIGGFSRVLLAGMDPTGTHALAPTIPEPVFMMYQMTFAIITPALITGAFADRMKFSSMLVFITLWSLLVYAPVAHTVWHPNGFMAKLGVLDFAGGTVVHINAGIAGLVACLVIGKRKGYPNADFSPHNLVLSLIGASLLWVGWFGFNAGSALTAGPRAGMAMTVTQVATAAAALAWVFVEWAVKGKPSVLGIISGAVAGLVAITPAAGFVDTVGAFAIGIAAGVICFFTATSMKRALGYDDSLDAFGVHGIGGIVGAILTGVFAKMSIANSEGAFATTLKDAPDTKLGLIEGNVGQVITQLEGVAFTVVWCAVITFILLKIIDLVIGLRVDEDIERDGLDIALHGESIH